MHIITNINEWQKIRKQLPGDKTVGYVPTMGNLHAGHISLCNRSVVDNDITVVSIFVNPKQFNQATDFDLYPRTLTEDKKLLANAYIDYLLLPDSHAMYPDDYTFQLTETQISIELEGYYRPGHFNGMLTVVLKLLNLVAPARAYFGEKDFQQCLLVKKMVAALFITTDIIVCETIRAADGVALSSRNSRLSSAERELAAHFPRLLSSALSCEKIMAELNQLGFKVDYIVDKWQRRLGAVWLGNTRLIDNVLIQ